MPQQEEHISLTEREAERISKEHAIPWPIMKRILKHSKGSSSSRRTADKARFSWSNMKYSKQQIDIHRLHELQPIIEVVRLFRTHLRSFPSTISQ